MGPLFLPGALGIVLGPFLEVIPIGPSASRPECPHCSHALCYQVSHSPSLILSLFMSELALRVGSSRHMEVPQRQGHPVPNPRASPMLDELPGTVYSC